MWVRPEIKTRPSRLSLPKILLGGLLVVGILAAFQLLTHHAEPEITPELPQGARFHVNAPVFDVLLVGEASVVVTNLAGWTGDQVRIYLHELKKANAKGALASVGIPAPSTSKGYEQGVVYLVDGHPADDLLAQFARKENPGYALIAPRVRGVYQWPPDHLVVGFPDGMVLD